eukprot:TRINITY_DN3358_c0_g2_i1.p2 TRINITY_DN3358_c0_g2~~TRINITY_DN3358_c0_g2_i1.p2  ORF type:complete len:307 (+),score=105.16 TRINITY_DN3358_c0_g2_i1:62-982(+)
MFGASQLFVSAAPAQKEAAVKPARKEEKMQTLPTTLRAIRAAAERRATSDENLRFAGGLEPEVLVVVAAIEACARQAASVELLLNDGTARMKARYYFIGGDAEAAVEGLRAGMYVHVCGGARTAPELHLGVLTVRQIKSADEVSYHMISCAHAALRAAQRSSVAPAADAQAAAVPMDASTPPPKQRQPETLNGASDDAQGTLATPWKSQQGGRDPTPLAVFTPAAAPVAAAVAPVASPPPLSAAVAQILANECPDNGAGLGLGDYAALLRAKGVAAEEASIRAHLERLVEEGEAINTIDDDHFGPV